MTNSKNQIIYCPLPEDDPVFRKPNLQKIRQTFDWSPKIGLQEGLEKTIAYFRNDTRILMQYVSDESSN